MEKKSSSKVAGFLIIIVLVIGLGATVIATQRSTEIRQRAEHPHKTIKLPRQADTQDTVSLGEKIHPKTGKPVKGIAIVHRISPIQSTQSGITNSSACYGFFAQGSKWKIIEPWVFDPYNNQGLDQNTLFDIQTKDILKWEDAADGKIGNRRSIDILGDGSITSVPLSADLLSPDGINEVYFGDIQTQGAIAVTVVWGVFDGPIVGRQLVEWDQVFDDTHFPWTATGDPAKMDFENISTHELGHAMGLIDLYDPVCYQQTMYGYASFGQTQKSTLEKGDINGINLFY